jgi:GTP-binding protein
LAEQNFVDYVKIMFRSGHGGAGFVHFFRSKGVPKGGPDGGNGGRGGHIILRGNGQLWTLLHLKYRKHIFAKDGTGGGENNCTGSDGEDVIVDVPLGTIAVDPETGDKLLEITNEDEQKILLPGGRGGKGNAFFTSSTHQAPDYAQPGEDGKESWIVLELKILADVGLVGFPNAGKSTLLSSLSAARPKIADYAFTTLTPQLGIVAYRDGRSFVMADIPGIIEDAHLGKGLGTRFLRHIERNSLLLFMIPCDSHEIKKDFQILVNELKQHNPELLDKPRLLAITKTDIVEPEWLKLIRPELPDGIETVFISSVTGAGLDALKDSIWKLLQT